MYGDENNNYPNTGFGQSVNPPEPPVENRPSETYPGGYVAYTESTSLESTGVHSTAPEENLSIDAFVENDTPTPEAAAPEKPYTPAYPTGQIPPYTAVPQGYYAQRNSNPQGYPSQGQGYTPQGYTPNQGYAPQTPGYNPQSYNPQSYTSPSQSNTGNTNPQGQSYDPYAYANKPTGTSTPSKPKKNRTGLIAALFLAVTVLAGGFGIGAGFILSESLPDTPEASDSPSPSASPSAKPAPSASEKPSGVGKDRPIIETTLPEGQMSIQDVYDVGILSAVAIYTETEDSNAFGQPMTQTSAGSGFVITTDGYIITNYHVIQDAHAIRVVMYDGTPYSAEIIGGDELNDIAVIKIEATGLIAAAVGDSDELRVGDTVLAIGNPLGELQNTLTVGYLSAKERAINIDNITCIMMQTDLAISPGNSGGPLFNLSGQVVGITSAKTVSTDVEGISFSIPINHAVKMINEILENGEITGQAYFGIECQDASTVVEEDLPEGVYIAVVNEGGPAEDAGLRKGDVITAVNGQKVKSVIELLAQKNKYKSGDTVALTVVRDGNEMEISLTFGDVPENLNETEPDSGEMPTPDSGYGDDFPWDSFPDDFWDNW